MEERDFYTVVYSIDNVEYVDEYEDLYTARNDFVTMINNEDIDYAVCQHVVIDSTGYEDITEIYTYPDSEEE